MRLPRSFTTWQPSPKSSSMIWVCSPFHSLKFIVRRYPFPNRSFSYFWVPTHLNSPLLMMPILSHKVSASSIRWVVKKIVVRALHPNLNEIYLTIYPTFASCGKGLALNWVHPGKQLEDCPPKPLPKIVFFSCRQIVNCFSCCVRWVSLRLSKENWLFLKDRSKECPLGDHKSTCVQILSYFTRGGRTEDTLPPSDSSALLRFTCRRPKRLLQLSYKVLWGQKLRSFCQLHLALRGRISLFRSTKKSWVWGLKIRCHRFYVSFWWWVVFGEVATPK